MFGIEDSVLHGLGAENSENVLDFSQLFDQKKFLYHATPQD